MHAHRLSPPARFLFSTWDGGGNVQPALTIARRLCRRGHSVRVLAPPSLRVRIEAAGCEFVPYTSVPNGAPSAAGTTGTGRVHAALVSPELARAAPALRFAEDVLFELDRSRADVLVVDFMLAGAIAAGECAGIPTAALMHTVYCLPASGRPPFGPAFKRASGPAARARDAIVAAVARAATMESLHDLNIARGTIGLKPVASASEQLERLARVLVLTSASFDPPPASLPSNVCYVGPQLDRPPNLERQPSLPFSSDDLRPLVVVSFSSRFGAPALVQRVVKILGELGVRGLLTLGPALAQAQLEVPPNVVVRRYVRHTEVLAGARLVITHAGLGTVMAALAHGVPLVCIPLKNDQYENAARVVASGAGRRLARHATRSSTRRAILQVLGEPRFADAAARLARELGMDDARAVRELEALTAPRESGRPPSPTSRAFRAALQA